jgi:hypothetical protein
VLGGDAKVSGVAFASSVSRDMARKLLRWRAAAAALPAPAQPEARALESQQQCAQRVRRDRRRQQRSGRGCQATGARRGQQALADVTRVRENARILGGIRARQVENMAERVVQLETRVTQLRNRIVELSSEADGFEAATKRELRRL